jgi:hypothetical protein
MPPKLLCHRLSSATVHTNKAAKVNATAAVDAEVEKDDKDDEFVNGFRCAI